MSEAEHKFVNLQFVNLLNDRDLKIMKLIDCMECVGCSFCTLSKPKSNGFSEVCASLYLMHKDL